MPAPTTTKPLTRFVLPDDVPPLARAASLALAIARHCKATTWAEFADRIAAHDDPTLLLLAGLDIDPDDMTLIEEWDASGVLRLLHVRPALTVAVCPVCQAWVLVASGPPPTRCKTSLRCEGKPTKAGIAVKEKPAPAEPAEK